MINEAQTMLAVSSAGALWLTAAGVAVVAVLIAAFVVGGRRAAQRKVSTPVRGPNRPAESWLIPHSAAKDGALPTTTPSRVTPAADHLGLSQQCGDVDVVLREISPVPPVARAAELSRTGEPGAEIAKAVAPDSR